jgi:hypothetical protein
MDSSVVIAAILLAVTVILVGIGIFNSIRSNRKKFTVKSRPESDDYSRPYVEPAPQPNNHYGQHVNQMQTRINESRPGATRIVEDDGFATSLMVGAVTGDPLLGMVAGGNIAGALIGDAIHGDDTPTQEYSTPTDYKDYAGPTDNTDPVEYAKPEEYASPVEYAAPEQTISDSTNYESSSSESSSYESDSSSSDSSDSSSSDN